MYIRGDANADGGMDIADASTIFVFLFIGGRDPVCLDSLDFNADRDLNITDGIGLLDYLFGGGPEPAAPFPRCGSGDPDLPGIGCEESSRICAD